MFFVYMQLTDLILTSLLSPSPSSLTPLFFVATSHPSCLSISPCPASVCIKRAAWIKLWMEHTQTHDSRLSHNNWLLKLCVCVVSMTAHCASLDLLLRVIQTFLGLGGAALWSLLQLSATTLKRGHFTVKVHFMHNRCNSLKRRSNCGSLSYSSYS